MEPIRLFVGADGNGYDLEAEMTLEYSVRRNTTGPVEITWMRANHDPDSCWGCWDMSRWSTPFSGFRWAIPEYCRFEGRAIYTDNDVLFLGDLRELWESPLEDGRVIAAKGNGRFCVMLLDCARVPDIGSVEGMKTRPFRHAQLCQFFADSSNGVQKFDRQWNNFDGENDVIARYTDGLDIISVITEIKALHLTDMSTNPYMVLARKRLEAEGRTSWYDGPVRDHRRPDVVELVNEYYEHALDAGYELVDYEPETRYGPYRKQSQAGYTAGNGFDVTRKE